MKLVYKNVGHILRFEGGYVNELIIENKKLFFDVVNSTIVQADGLHGDWVLSIKDTPVEFSKHTDVTLQFAPFQLNRKSLITKLCAELEKNAVKAESYMKTNELLCELEAYVHTLAEELSFDIDCKKLAIGQIIRALAPEVDESDKSPMERIFSYMETVRELDRDRLFIMINMRSYFGDTDMNSFVQSVCLHDFKVLLLESTSSSPLIGCKRYTVDEDLCEF